MYYNIYIQIVYIVYKTLYTDNEHCLQNNIECLLIVVQYIHTDSMHCLQNTIYRQ